MAQGKGGRGQGSKRPEGDVPKPARERKPVVDRRVQPPPGSRQSVAAARQTSAGSNRTQLIIGSVAVVLIAIVVVVGLVLNKNQNAAPVTNYPKSVSSISSVSGGVVTVTGSAAGATPKLTLDLFEDGICSACQSFEGQYGQQIMQAVDQGKLTVRYHFMNFLNAMSPSHDYSTRAAAAFECVAQAPADANAKGLFMNFHTTMFTDGVKPAENGTADLSNAQIAAIAVKAGAPQSAATCITAGTNIDQAKTTAAAAAATLTKAIGGDTWGTPTAMKNGALLDLNSTDWLTSQLA